MFSHLDPREILLSVPVILFSLTLHEYAHARAAEWLGDPTARMMGRVTMNPLVHLDPIGTLMLLFGPFGWARPVPFDPRHFRDRRQGVFLVASAGPASNLLLALLLGLGLRFALPAATMPNLPEVMVRAVLINLGLALFNLLPVPPLDGSRIMASVLPPRWAIRYEAMEPYAPFILLLLILPGFVSDFNPLWSLIGPAMMVLFGLFTGVGGLT